MMSMNLMTKTAAMSAVLHPAIATMTYAAVRGRAVREDSEVRWEKQVPPELQEHRAQAEPQALPGYRKQ